jgi:hypothetical protein
MTGRPDISLNTGRVDFISPVAKSVQIVCPAAFKASSSMHGRFIGCLPMGRWVRLLEGNGSRRVNFRFLPVLSNLIRLQDSIAAGERKETGQGHTPCQSVLQHRRRDFMGRCRSV